MADHQGYAIHTHHIPVDVFLDMIESNIKKLIHTHGHKDCGLRHEELCKEIKKIIHDNKQIVFQYMDPHSKVKWSKEWDSRRSIYFKKLFEQEGFINVCYPPKEKGDSNLQKLKLKHIEFCKEKDKRRSAVGNNPEYSVCKQYNVWINERTTSFTREFLKNVSDSNIQTVKKYFITKAHPKGYDPRDTYRNSKLNCEIYNPASSSHPQIPLAKESPDRTHLPTAPAVRRESQGKDGISAPGVGGGIEITKSDVKQLPKNEPPASDTQTSSLINRNVDGTPNGKLTDLKANGTDSQVNAQGPTGKSTEATDTKAPSSQQLPKSPRLISPNDLPAPKVPDTPPPVIKGQRTVSDSTPRTTSAASGTTYSTENVQSHLAPDLPLTQLQPSAVAAVIDQHSNEPTPPHPVSKSIDQDTSLTSASDPGLAPSQAVTSNSSTSVTSSTATISTPGSSLAQDPHLPTPSTQPVVTTSIATTLTQTTTSVSDSTTITAPTMSTKPISTIVEITSTTGESGKLNTPLKTITGSQGPNSASPKNKDDPLQPNKDNTYQTNTTFDQK